MLQYRMGYMGARYNETKDSLTTALQNVSPVVENDADVFKYYQFFNADTEDEFNDFYDNIKKMSMYDTGVDASFGDEFITLSVCAYHVENGRLVVVGKRIR